MLCCKECWSTKEDRLSLFILENRHQKIIKTKRDFVNGHNVHLKEVGKEFDERAPGEC